MIQNLCSEEIEVLLAIFALETWSEFTIKAPKDNVSQLLGTTDKETAMRKVSAGDAAEICVSLGRLLNGLSPEVREGPSRQKSGSRFPSYRELWTWVSQLGSP